MSFARLISRLHLGLGTLVLVTSGCGTSTSPEVHGHGLIRPQLGAHEVPATSPANAADGAFFHFADAEDAIGFDDIVGADDAKVHLQELVATINDPARYQALGVNAAKGIMLVGPPGVGKTLLARATGQAANVRTLVTSGAQLLEPSFDATRNKYVGAIDKLRILFDTARAHAPCIVFIDELDVLGAQETVSKQLGIELDGFSRNEQVHVIGALNKLHLVSDALRRPGRFDHVVFVQAPHAQARLSLLERLVTTRPQGQDVQLRRVVRMTAGASGAQVVHLANAAATIAARRGHDAVMQSDWEEAYDEMTIGPRKPVAEAITATDRWRSAVHEAGHALVATLHKGVDRVRKVTLVPRGDTLGHTALYSREDKDVLSSAHDIEGDLAMMLGGRVAETLIFGRPTDGASSDLFKASLLARHAVTEAGMGERTGAVSYSDAEHDFTAALKRGGASLDRIDSDVAQLVRRAEATATALLKQRRALIEQVARRLMTDDEMTGEQIEAMVAAKTT